MNDQRARLARKLAAMIAVAAALAGCQRHASHSTSNSTSSITAASTATKSSDTSSSPPSDVITWETAGNPVKQLKIGQSVTYTVGGLTVTVKVNSLEPAPDYPKSLDQEDPTGTCKSWWKASQTTTFAGKNVTWKWSLKPIDALGIAYDDLPRFDVNHESGEGASSTHQEGDILQESLKASMPLLGKKDFDPVTFTGLGYYPVCQHVPGQGEVPRVESPLGLSWIVSAPRELSLNDVGKLAVIWKI